METRVAVVVPTCNAGAVFGVVVDALCNQSQELAVTVVDSASIDSTLAVARRADFNLIEISRETFNHGGTRQVAVDCLTDKDIVVFLTQDAILISKDAIEHMLKYFEDKNVAAVCGRQLPRKESTSIEAHARLYNYSSKPCIRSVNDVKSFGLKTVFISNSFSAYRISALNEVGGFPENVIFGEDMYVAAKLINAGYKIAYAADTGVYHSHDYSIWQEFKRYFDMGVFHSHEPWIRQDFGGAEGEGAKFVVSEFKYLLKHEAVRIPEAFFRTILRYTGFRLGLLEKWLPLRLKRSFAMNKGYFKE